MHTRKRSRLLRLWASLALFALSGCAVVVPNTKFCAVAGVVEGGLDCFHTLSDEEDHIDPVDIKDFLEPMPPITDLDGTVLDSGHGAAICQPVEDWSAEHAAMEQACEKLGASCTYDMREMIDSVNKKVQNLQEINPGMTSLLRSAPAKSAASGSLDALDLRPE